MGAQSARDSTLRECRAEQFREAVGRTARLLFDSLQKVPGVAGIRRSLSLSQAGSVRMICPTFITGGIMDRRELLRGASAVLGAVACARLARADNSASSASGMASAPVPLSPPSGSIPVAFLISPGAVVIDFCGPWAVFESVGVEGRAQPTFHLYTVAESRSPVIASSGMKIVPDFTLQTAPPPKVLVIPAQNDLGARTLEWIRSVAATADVTMSVCTGALLLAKTGLLDGKPATTHHSAYRQLALEFPKVEVRRGARFVESGNLATAGGLSSGIDLALRVVERYFGRDVATQTAYYLEYQGQGWLDPNSNSVYAARIASSPGHPVCPVCEMEVDLADSPPHSKFDGTTYYFCMPSHKVLFDAAPQKYVQAHAT
jgi:putative intracellular protease/amidase/YHS domain-containing protein